MPIPIIAAVTSSTRMKIFAEKKAMNARIIYPSASDIIASELSCTTIKNPVKLAICVNAVVD